MNPAKPLHLKVLEGTDRKDRPAATAPMGTDPLDKLPPVPGTLKGVGRSLWKKKVKAMEDLGILSSLDLPVIEAACLAYEKFTRYEKEAEELRTRAEEFLKTNQIEEWSFCMKGIAAAEVGVSKWMKHFLDYQAKLGWSPVDRQKVKAPPPVQEENPLLKLMRKRA